MFLPMDLFVNKFKQRLVCTSITIRNDKINIMPFNLNMNKGKYKLYEQKRIGLSMENWRKKIGKKILSS